MLRDDVCHLQARDVKRLRGRVEDDGLGINGAHGYEGVAGHDEFAMDLIGDDADMVPVADVSHAVQLVTGPYTARGVVGVAKQEDGGLLVSTDSLKGGPVDGKGSPPLSPPKPSRREGEGSIFVALIKRHTGRIMVIIAGEPQQAGLSDFAAIVADAGEEAVVVGREDEHPFTRHCQGLDGYRHGRNDASGVEDPVSLDVPLVAAMEPRNDGIVVVGLDVGIAKDWVLSTALDSLLNGRSHRKVHVSDPEGEDTPPRPSQREGGRG